MRRSWYAVALAAVVLLATAVPTRAQETVGSSECCQPLLAPIGARALGLGNALTARRGGDVLYVNPAGIAALGKGEFRVHSERTDVDQNTTTFATLFGVGGVGYAAITYRLLDYGDIPAANSEGSPTGTLRLTDQLLGASFATTALPGIQAGVTYMLYQWRQDCSGYCEEKPFAGTTHMVDLGVRAQPGWVPSLEMGASVVHLGLPLQVKNAAQADPSPARLRVGAAYEVLHHFQPDSTVKLVASADVTRAFHQGVASMGSLGLELSLDNALFLRGGYATGSGVGSGGAVGVGLIYERFDVSVAKSFSTTQMTSEPFQVTFAIRF